MTIRAKDNQSLFDLAIQSSGSIEAAVSMAVLNDLALSDELVPGTAIEESSVVSSQIVNYYISRGILPATATTQTDAPPTSDLGIEFWTIETDFIVN